MKGANYRNFDAIYVNPETLNDLHCDIQSTTAPQGSTIKGGLIMLANVDVESTQLNSIMVTLVFHNSNSNKSKTGASGEPCQKKKRTMTANPSPISRSNALERRVYVERRIKKVRKL